MSNYMPKVGDRVRATLGENVLVGEVVTGPDDVGAYNIDIGPQVRMVHPSIGWQFEQIVDVPTKFGAVIRRADGEKFVLSSPNSFDCWYGGKRLGWTREEHATNGGFTVLFEGVDE